MRCSDWSSDVCSSYRDILYRNPDEDESFTGFKTLSQEFRLTGATDRVDWMVGFFYSDEDLDRTEPYRIGPHYEPYLSIALLPLVNPALGTLPHAPARHSVVSAQRVSVRGHPGCCRLINKNN